MARLATAAIFLFLTAPGLHPTDAPAASGIHFPYREKLSYRVEWRMVTAGNAIVQLSPGKHDTWDLDLHIESAGLVSRLYRVLDTYRVESGDHFCGTSAVLDAQEGKRHLLTRLTFQAWRKKVLVEEHDYVKNVDQKNELDAPPCTYEIAGAMAELRTMNLAPGKSITLPVTNGKKLASIRIEALTKESLTVNGKSYPTIRYEAFLFDNVLYKHKGRLFIWLTDDSDHLPVEFKLQMGFPLGSITLELEKQEKQ